MEALIKATNDKKGLLNIPLNLEKGDSKKTALIDEEGLQEHIDKLRESMMQEVKKIKDELFKFHIEFESKIREKIDKKDLEDIESKLSYGFWNKLLFLERMMVNVDQQIINGTKKFVERTEMKKLKAIFDK